MKRYSLVVSALVGGLMILAAVPVADAQKKSGGIPKGIPQERGQRACNGWPGASSRWTAIGVRTSAAMSNTRWP